MANEKINPEEFANDHRVAYLVSEWKRLSQAERDATELAEVDPGMRELADKELKDIGAEKDRLMAQIESIVGAPRRARMAERTHTRSARGSRRRRSVAFCRGPCEDVPPLRGIARLVVETA